MEENIADALRMAGAVLLFVIALGMTISSFTQAKQSIDTIIKYADREYDYTYVEQNGSTERIVGVETIIPVIYRSFKENYKIYFFTDSTKTEGIKLYTKTDSSGTNTEINFIDLQRKDIVTFGNDKQEENFIMAILYGNGIQNYDEIKSYFYNNYKITFNDLNSDGLYGTIKEKKFIEQIGEYYLEDEGQGSSESETPDSNKTKKRVYTYMEVN